MERVTTGIVRERDSSHGRVPLRMGAHFRIFLKQKNYWSCLGFEPWPPALQASSLALVCRALFYTLCGRRGRHGTVAFIHASEPSCPGYEYQVQNFSGKISLVAVLIDSTLLSVSVQRKRLN